jgi:hypothetical protein
MLLQLYYSMYLSEQRYCLLIRYRILTAQKVRIRPTPDPQHRFGLNFSNERILSGEALIYTFSFSSFITVYIDCV